MPKKKRLTAAERRIILEKNKKILRRVLKYKTNIIGLDIGTNTTGLFSDITGGIALSGYNDRNRYNRIYMISDHFKDIINSDHFKMKADKTIAILEDYSFSLQSSRLAQIAELTGIIKLHLLTNKIPYLTIAPQTLKKFVLGPSRTSQQKQFILLEALSRWGQKFKDDNVCDAFCLYKFLWSIRQFLLEKKKYKKWEQDMFSKFITDRGILQKIDLEIPSEEEPYP